MAAKTNGGGGGDLFKLLFAGAGSGAITKTAIAPLERIKILFQIQGMHPELKLKYHGIVQTGVTVVKEEGLRALYKGNGANVLRIVPTYALKFAFNDTFKNMVRKPGQKQPLSFMQMMGAGTAAGLTQITITYPLEVVRTRLCLSEGMRQGAQYNGIIDCARTTLRTEGVRSFYKGILPTWLSGAPYVGLQMTFYDLNQRLVAPTIGGGVGAKLVAGAMSGLIAQTITYPGDTIRRRMQTNGIGGAERIYKNDWDCVKVVFRREGIRGFYKGLAANCVRCIPGAGIQFLAYDSLKWGLGISV